MMVASSLYGTLVTLFTRFRMASALYRYAAMASSFVKKSSGLAAVLVWLVYHALHMERLYLTNGPGMQVQCSTEQATAVRPFDQRATRKRKVQKAL